MFVFLLSMSPIFLLSLILSVLDIVLQHDILFLSAYRRGKYLLPFDLLLPTAYSSLFFETIAEVKASTHGSFKNL